MLFQSTLSSRRATDVLTIKNAEPCDFNPRSPHGERLPDTLSSSRVEKKFQSTLSSRRATVEASILRGGTVISIHALLTESDVTRDAPYSNLDYFNPRSPHGERRPMLRLERTQRRYFNPRSPHGERRRTVIFLPPVFTISIHALLTESDSAIFPRSLGTSTFQSTLSSRRATIALHFVQVYNIEFQSTLSSRRATGSVLVGRERTRNFNPRSPHGERPGLCGEISR